MKNILDMDSESTTIFDNSFLIDTHCHLDMVEYAGDLDKVLERAMACGVKKVITIGIDTASSMHAVELAQRYKQLSATIGVHPHDIDNLRDTDYRLLEEIYRNHPQHIVGFGEIGLDYYKGYSDPARQRHHLEKQLDLAHELKLPVIIHNRAADDDIYRILSRAKSFDYGGVMHCFSGDYQYARKIIDLGLHISIPGVVTFKNSLTLQEVAERIPISSMLLETDGPFLAPHPYRGKRNEPAYLVYSAKRIADLRKMDVNVIATQTSHNAQKLFSLLD
jgi:TatD DNase family protein